MPIQTSSSSAVTVYADQRFRPTEVLTSLREFAPVTELLGPGGRAERSIRALQTDAEPNCDVGCRAADVCALLR